MDEAQRLIHRAGERVERNRLARVLQRIRVAAGFREQDRVPLVRGGVAAVEGERTLELTLRRGRITLLEEVERRS